ncbi:hypothetical protein A2223_02965 [Candidatus Falkowbacteria bacterium RIFOXYA2_FULL_35_8]|uniref:Uncharacterized protein n=1 Tax=Candidatus Falkowbacteria bacterium RIFOXYC2_FULL_36_12 TaxID=1798002 RepID=A0A1F5SZJ4_9BACT|nr:MAG: hypothetical protein A2300_03375 [Candidatus Falkowbacteria bacterium RIFOXYB2_FULL_35_7]OGF31916.1 MAG: hypothetical protein A2478_05565 [Candidatus Falkowbacteria bacterium RIFOXYC2_FULL_36_12]OGF34678.1 MAG: hypothetical protein A2223_02965 [Candidatus Falkowbacteria bacterium RIFOXYA2_FULL_35_8]
MQTYIIALGSFFLFAIILYFYNRKTRGWLNYVKINSTKILYSEEKVKARLFIKVREYRTKGNIYLTDQALFFVVKGIIWWKINFVNDKSDELKKVFSGEYCIARSNFQLKQNKGEYVFAEEKMPTPMNKVVVKIYSANCDKLLRLIKGAK